ncbi:MAG TPA: trypsin-like peptidase domain-containing protein [Candidatus Sulfotelmatobacter sp.]|nr:trypsin-like peptidase domain-containing protein [Candidatus Sulfotelmatobacter sp.]
MSYLDRNVLTVSRLGLLAAAVVLLYSSTASSQSDFLSNLNESLEQVVSKVKPSVVRIDVITRDGPSYDGAAIQQDQTSQSGFQQIVGSGLILSPDGYIMTNAHVVRGATSIQVVFDSSVRRTGKNRSNLLRARVVGEFREADLALLKVDTDELTPITLQTNSANLREGQLVFSVGSPEGLSNTISLGVISSLGRQLDPDGPISYIQTDAAVNPGSSGGALVDTKGRLIGINAMLMTEGGGNERLGFAIPSRFVELAYQNLREQGKVVWGEPGLKVQGITPFLAQGLHLSQNSGVIVSDVIPGSPAAMTGLKILDVVTHLDGIPIENVSEYFETLYHKKPGQELAMSVARRGKRIDFAISLLPATEQSEAPGESDSTINLVSRLGVFCSALSSHSQAAVQKLRSRRGVFVEARSSAETQQTQLMPGDVIRSVNLRPVFTVGDLEDVLDRTSTSRPLILQIERDFRFVFLTLEQ